MVSPAPAAPGVGGRLSGVVFGGGGLLPGEAAAPDLLAHHSQRAGLATEYLDDPPTLLMPVQMGTYTAHVAMTVVITSLFVDLLAHWAMLIAFLVMVGYLLVFRLTVPYAIVRRHPERSLLLLLLAFHRYAQVLRPVVIALRA